MKKKNIYKTGMMIKPVMIAAFIILAGVIALLTSSGDTAGDDLVISGASEESTDTGIHSDRDHINETEEKNVSVTENTSAVYGSHTADGNDMALISSEQFSDDLVVYICGEVSDPGLYRCSKDHRIADVVEMAGGLLPEADDTCVNMAARVADAQQIIITKKGETPITGSGPGTSVSGTGSTANDQVQGNGLVNINTADEAALRTLPGIGEQKAKAIISYRQNGGNFTKIEDIMNVSGIKDGAFNKIKDLITV